jgi:hypothetical protein
VRCVHRVAVMFALIALIALVVFEPTSTDAR